MNGQEQPQPKRVNVGRGTYVLLVIGGILLLLGGLSAASHGYGAELLDTVRHEMGPIVVIGEINFVNMLPKTRSGKIMRRVLRSVTLDREPGDVSTIEDEGSVEEARQAWQQLKGEIKA